MWLKLLQRGAHANGSAATRAEVGKKSKSICISLDSGCGTTAVGCDEDEMSDGESFSGMRGSSGIRGAS